MINFFEASHSSLLRRYCTCHVCRNCAPHRWPPPAAGKNTNHRALPPQATASAPNGLNVRRAGRRFGSRPAPATAYVRAFSTSSSRVLTTIASLATISGPRPFASLSWTVSRQSTAAFSTARCARDGHLQSHVRHTQTSLHPVLHHHHITSSCFPAT